LVLCHPDDEVLLREHTTDLGSRSAGQVIAIEVKASHDIQRGGCLVKFEEGLLDARMETQLAELSSAVARSMAPPGGRVRAHAGGPV
jgi:flagellar biosynthesis/type III secretory pathway protein FliH